jgi:peptide deformylase
MIKELKKYPDDSVNVNAGPIRGFNKEYQELLDNLIDTATYHKLEALSAIQIGQAFQIFIIKENDTYIPYVNARIIRQSEPFNSTEECSYFFNKPINIGRYQNLSIVHDTKDGTVTKTINTKEEAAVFSRMIDWTFNTSLIDRLHPAQKEQAIKALAGDGHMPDIDSAICPTDSKKDYFISVVDKLLFFMLVSLVLPLFNISKDTLESWYSYDKYATVGVIALLIGFFFYAQYEAKKYKQCTSCQIGNQIGIILMRLPFLIIFATASYFILG